MKFSCGIAPALLCFLLFSCVKKEEKTEAQLSGATYFSIVQFAEDQFHTHWGQPFTFVKTVRKNEKVDSSYVAAKDVDWAKELKPFFESDISNPKFLDQYNFSVLNDDVTVSKTYYYEAKTPELFTRSFQIITDPFTDKVKNIFIETQKDGRVHKLYYTPLKLIQIQEFDKSLIGGQNNVRVEYRFLY
ncbi:MAG TPA: hypothetical protein PL009_10285 [Flavipsychrobacter sp.]|nr:hypothetical protein [Flavipsychrobacter sp.]